MYLNHTRFLHFLLEWYTVRVIVYSTCRVGGKDFIVVDSSTLTVLALFLALFSRVS